MKNLLAVFAFRRAINFIHNDKTTTYTNMAWFVGNLFKKRDKGVLFTYIYELVVKEEDMDSFSIVNDEVEH